MRLRRIALADIVPRALVDGPVLLSADITEQIDNMEGSVFAEQTTAARY